MNKIIFAIAMFCVVQASPSFARSQQEEETIIDYSLHSSLLGSAMGYCSALHPPLKGYEKFKACFDGAKMILADKSTVDLVNASSVMKSRCRNKGQDLQKCVLAELMKINTALPEFFRKEKL